MRDHLVDEVGVQFVLGGELPTQDLLVLPAQALRLVENYFELPVEAGLRTFLAQENAVCVGLRRGLRRRQLQALVANLVEGDVFGCVH